jgi:hypothetical protein
MEREGQYNINHQTKPMKMMNDVSGSAAANGRIKQKHPFKRLKSRLQT